MSQSQETRDNRKAVETILAHLSQMRENRPSQALSQGRSLRAFDTISRIITAARRRFTEDGHAALTLRDVAKEAGVAVGNLTYYFPTKQSLLDAMLREALADYVEDHLRQFKADRDTPLEILLNVVAFYVANARISHRFFFQMWGYAGSDETAKQTVRSLYRPIGRFIYYLVRAANPRLNDTQIRQAVLQIFSLEEGYKLFIGMGPDGDPALETAEQDIRTLTKRIVFAE